MLKAVVLSLVLWFGAAEAAWAGHWRFVGGDRATVIAVDQNSFRTEGGFKVGSVLVVFRVAQPNGVDFYNFDLGLDCETRLFRQGGELGFNIDGLVLGRNPGSDTPQPIQPGTIPEMAELAFCRDQWLAAPASASSYDAAQRARAAMLAEP
jgi:hypothetical protein